MVPGVVMGTALFRNRRSHVEVVQVVEAIEVIDGFFVDSLDILDDLDNLARQGVTVSENRIERGAPGAMLLFPCDVG
jgi:hypothetical protein